MNGKAPAGAAHATWSDLVSELDRWEETRQVATLWWRDDDAVAMTPALARLLSLAGPTPLALAVIPEKAEPGLASVLRARQSVAVLQHGWSHANHAGSGKKSEFPAERPEAEVATELSAGHRRLTDLFGATAVAPVLAPPWNRFAPELEGCLAGAGIAALSTMGSRPAGAAARVDVHVDLVAWKAGRGFVGTTAAIGGVIGELRRRHRGEAAGPVGILTHHLIMDSATAAFMAELVAVVAAHKAARWADIREVAA